MANKDTGYFDNIKHILDKEGNPLCGAVVHKNTRVATSTKILAKECNKCQRRAKNRR